MSVIARDPQRRAELLFAIMEPKLDRLYRAAYERAVSVLQIWIAERGYAKLRAEVEKLDDACRIFLAEVPSPFAKDSLLKRRLHWLDYWLAKKSKKDCTKDILDILDHDLPEIRADLLNLCATHWELDDELWDEVQGQIETKKLSDAVRNAFLVLTDRLRKLEPNPKERDGYDLVEELFGDKGRTISYLTEKRRHGIRHLLLGLYSTKRNPYFHKRIQPRGPEAIGIVMMIDTVLSDLSAIKDLKKNAAGRTGQKLKA